MNWPTPQVSSQWRCTRHTQWPKPISCISQLRTFSPFSWGRKREETRKYIHISPSHTSLPSNSSSRKKTQQKTSAASASSNTKMPTIMSKNWWESQMKTSLLSPAPICSTKVAFTDLKGTRTGSGVQFARLSLGRWSGTNPQEKWPGSSTRWCIVMGIKMLAQLSLIIVCMPAKEEMSVSQEHTELATFLTTKRAMKFCSFWKWPSTES